MSDAAVQLKVAGKTYQVVTSAAPDELHRLAAKVEEALLCVSPEGREPSASTLVLAAITLAHELEEERALRGEAEERHKTLLKKVITRVDLVLNDELFKEAQKQGPQIRVRATPVRARSSTVVSSAGQAFPSSVPPSGETAPVLIKSGHRSEKARSV